MSSTRNNELKQSMLREFVMRTMNNYMNGTTPYSCVLMALQIYQEINGFSYGGDIVTEDCKFVKGVKWSVL